MSAVGSFTPSAQAIDPEARANLAAIEQSWKRSLDVHRLDPGSMHAPRVLPTSELREHREPMGGLMHVARSGMESLFQQVRDAGYVVLLTDAEGVSVDFITNPSYDRELRRAGLYLGSCWSETIEGTCAVGLCAADKLALTVHHGEHFRAPNQSLTCSAAPILAPDGRLLGVLDASALQSPDDRRSQHLVLQIVKSTARMIESANFLRQFERQWVLRVNTRREFLEVATEGLIAIDGGGQIIAANQRFLHDVGRSADSLVGQHVEDIFGIGFDELVHAPHDDPIALRLLHSGSRCFAVPRAPRRAAGAAPVRATRTAATVAARREGGASALDALAGGDARMLANARRAVRVLDRGITVLLQGESGTGKEAFAKAMHEASARRAGPFVALNCAAIPESLIESELFGYRDGAFTGARAKGARGKITQANGGTLFLDEIGDMPLALQTRLLRVLAEREVLPLGAERPEPVDLQVVCATHRDLMELVHAGQFRLDLYYRLNGLTLMLPALRERSDKRELIEALLRQEAADAGHAGEVRIAMPALALLLEHPWPGNIRELKNTLRSALALSEHGLIDLEHLPAQIQGSGGSMAPPQRLASVQVPALPAETGPTGTDGADDRTALLAALRQHRWNVTAAARSLGACRATVYRKMERYGIVPPNQQG